MGSRLVKYILIAVLLTSCAGSLDRLFKEGYVKETSPRVLSSVYKEHNHTFKYDSLSGDGIKLTYLGSGGFILERDSISLMIDPYFSHQNILKLALSKLLFIKTLKTDIEAADQALINYKGKTSSIWVSHAHYDHLMDVPYVYGKYAKEGANVYCSQSGANNLKHVKAVKEVTILDSSNISYVDHLGASFYLENKRIKVTPILGEHAPHFGNIKFYKGKAKPNKKYTTPLSRSRAEMWKEGLTFSFVFDFLDEKGNIDFRMFLQSSAATPEMGFIPKYLKDEHAVDLAILGAASFANVKDYPTRLIKENLTPKYLIICHWEDFFRPYNKQRKKIVRATDLEKFIQKLTNIYPWKDSSGREKFILPRPGTIITIK